jgi:hypothetical protein
MWHIFKDSCVCSQILIIFTKFNYFYAFEPMKKNGARLIFSQDLSPSKEAFSLCLPSNILYASIFKYFLVLKDMFCLRTMFSCG